MFSNPCTGNTPVNLNISKFFGLILIVFNILVFAGVFPWNCSLTQKNPHKPNIIIISVDTLRADHVGTYGYPRQTSQYLDRLSKESILFTNVHAESPWTLPSHLSLLTGLYPGWHGGIDDTKKLSTGVTTLAEALKSNGYRTVAFTDGGYMSESYGFDRGFDIFNAKGEGQTRIHERAFKWLNGKPTTPFFLFLHYYDVHYPYNQPNTRNFVFFSESETQLPLKGFKRLAVSDDQVEDNHEEINTDSKKVLTYINLYDDGIYNTDFGIGELFTLLKQLGYYDNSIIITLSDHGEEFGEHHTLFHSTTLYRELLEVPLIIKLPFSEQAGKMTGHPVQLCDIMPTLISYLGFKPIADIQGHDFSFLFSRAKPPSRVREACYGMTHYVGGKRSIQKNNTKCIVSLEPRKTEFINLLDDPGELISRQTPLSDNNNLATELIHHLEQQFSGIQLWFISDRKPHQLNFTFRFPGTVESVIPVFLEPDDNFEFNSDTNEVSGTFNETSHVDALVIRIPGLDEESVVKMNLSVDGKPAHAVNLHVDQNDSGSLTAKDVQSFRLKQITCSPANVPEIIPGKSSSPKIYVFKTAIPGDFEEPVIIDEELKKELKNLGYMQ